MVRVVLPLQLRLRPGTDMFKDLQFKMDRNAYPQRTPATYHHQWAKPKHESDHN